MRFKSMVQLIIAGALLATLLFKTPDKPNPVAMIPAEPATVTAPSTMLQYSADGHVLGFVPGKVYLAGLDHALTVELAGGQNSTPIGSPAFTSQQPGKAPAMGTVRYQNEWPGVDVIYTPTPNGLAESHYILQPGARVDTIRLRYNAPAQLMPDGTLQFAFETGMMNESAPVAFQEIAGVRTPVAVHFTLNDGLVGFNVGSYNPEQVLTIDPEYVWHTFYGSSSYDYAYAITSDGDGNIYAAGYSRTSWNGPGSTPPLHAHTTGSNEDIVVVKLNNAGAYQWHTFYGEVASADDGYGITSDGNGNIYISGTSAVTWSGPGSQAPLNAHKSGIDIVIIKLNSAGTYQWHTFYGSGCDDNVPGSIASDGSGNIVVSGQSCGFNGPGDTLPKNAYAGNYDILVVKLNSEGEYLWHTFYGSSTMWDYGRAITFDVSGNVLVAGDSDDPWVGPDSTAPLHTHSFGSNNDFVIVKMDGAGDYQWHTFYGSTAEDLGYALTSDGSGDVFLTGTSEATWNGPGSVAPLNAYKSDLDIAVIKLNSAGAYRWHTFYGSSSTDGGSSIISDEDGNIYVAGWSYTFQGPGDTAPLHANAGGRDIIAIKLDGGGVYQFHTFYGAEFNEFGRGITSDSNGDVFIAGQSSSSWDGPGSIAPLHSFTTSSADIMVLKLAFAVPNVVSSTLADPGPTGADSVDFTVTFSESVDGVDETDFTLTSSGLTGTAITGVSGSGESYIVTVDTGSGAGSLRLDVMDDDSILDETGHPLGGMGINNGTFTTGETCMVDKILPFASSSLRADPNPTSANSVEYTVTFSESVSGVDVSDFDLTTTGIFNGISTADISGSGTTYTITVNTGTGFGTLRLVVIDDDSIIDAAGNPLGGSGLGNGDFVTGELYAVRV